MPSQRSMNVFVSHAHERMPEATEIAEALRSAGHAVFLDEDSLDPGTAYHQRIREHVLRSDLMVFLASRESLEPGTYARTELELAREKWPNPDGKVLPVLLADIAYEELPAYLRGLTALKPQGSVAGAVVHAVERMAAARRSARHLRKSLVLIGLLLLALGLVYILRLGSGEKHAGGRAPLAPVPTFDPARWLADQNVPLWPLAVDSVAVAKLDFYAGLALNDPDQGSSAAQLVGLLRGQYPGAWALIESLGIRKLGPILVAGKSDKEFLFAVLLDRASFDDGSQAFASAGIVPRATRKVAGGKLRVFETTPGVEMAFSIVNTVPDNAPEDMPHLAELGRYSQVLLLGNAEIVEEALARRATPGAEAARLLLDVQEIAGFGGNWAIWRNDVEPGAAGTLLGVDVLQPRMILVGTNRFSLAALDSMDASSSTPLPDVSAKVLLVYDSESESSQALASLEALRRVASSRLDYGIEEGAAGVVADSMGLEILALIQILLESVRLARTGQQVMLLVETARMDLSTLEERVRSLHEMEGARAEQLRGRSLSPAKEDLQERIRAVASDKSKVRDEALAAELRGVSNPAEVLVPLIAESRNDWDAGMSLVLLISACRDHPGQLDDWMRNGVPDLLSLPAVPGGSGITAMLAQGAFGNIALGFSPPGNLLHCARTYSRTDFPPVFDLCLAQALALPNPKTLRLWGELLEILTANEEETAPFREVAGRSLGKCVALDLEVGFTNAVQMWEMIPDDVRLAMITQGEAELGGLTPEDRKLWRQAVLRLPSGPARAALIGIVSD